MERGGFAGFIDALIERFNPRLAEEKAHQKERTRDSFVQAQDNELAGKTAQLHTDKDSDLADLDERHAQQQRDHAARYDEEHARYAREHEAAEQLRTEIEAQRLQKELDDAQKSRDGPEWPPPRAR